MRSILCLDDERSFPFEEGDDAYMARNVGEALAVLGFFNGKIRPLDEIWLDYDLGYTSSWSDTADPVVDYLCELAFNGTPYPVGVIVLHTANPVGRDKMRMVLQRYGYFVIVREAHFGV